MHLTLLAQVGMTGFEPATTRPPDAYSNRAELHPALFNGCKDRYFSIHTKLFCLFFACERKEAYLLYGFPVLRLIKKEGFKPSFMLACVIARLFNLPNIALHDHFTQLASRILRLNLLDLLMNSRVVSRALYVADHA